VTDYVANGSFASLRENVEYLDGGGYAILVRLADSTRGWNGQYKYVSKDAYEFLKKSSLVPGDLVMSNVGEPGKVFLVPDLGKPMTLGPNSVLIRCNGVESTSSFLYYYFYSTQGRSQVDNISEGVAQKKFNKTAFRSLSILLPPLPEQQRIVGILDEAFDGIATAKANAEKNLQNARAIFESHLQSVFTQRGEGWVEKLLCEVCEFSQGIQVDVKLQSENKTSDNQVRFLRIVDFTQGSEPERYIDNPGKKFQVCCSDVSIVRYGASTGFVCSGLEGAIANNLFRVIPKGNYISNEFLYWLLKSALFQDEIRKSMSGAAMPAISFGMINDILLPFPSLSEQQQVVTKLNIIATETKRLESVYRRKLAALEALKKSMLHQAFTGNL
jgi:type I restriction enzyme S subunit